MLLVFRIYGDIIPKLCFGWWWRWCRVDFIKFHRQIDFNFLIKFIYDPFAMWRWKFASTNWWFMWHRERFSKMSRNRNWIFFCFVLDGEEYKTSRDRIELHADDRGVNNSILIIKIAELSDRKNYNCSGTNIAIQYGNANYSVAEEYIYVRVKGKEAKRNRKKFGISFSLHW